MADQHEVEITIKWQNDGYFEMSQKVDNGDPIVDIRVEENGDIAGQWGAITKICRNCIDRVLKQAGDEMVT